MLVSAIKGFMVRQAMFGLFLLSFFGTCKNKENSSGKNLDTDKTLSKVEWLNEWIAAWEFMADDVLELPKTEAPIMLFYDNNNVYTTSPISAPDGKPFDGPTYFGKKLPWKKQAHNDTLIIPDGQKIPVQLMTFAGPLKAPGVESFFVMAAPSFWKNAGIQSKEVGLKKMLTGVFLHEFAHTRQMNGLGKQITEYERNNKFDFEVSDDLIQAYFAEDSAYVASFTKEVSLLYKAVQGKNDKEVRTLGRQGIEMLRIRQKQYLSRENRVLVEMDNVFLTMEGIGQYMIVRYLASSKGGNVPELTAIEAARRNRKWWSQDEGLALVLLYERLKSNPDWEILFSKTSKDIVSLIEAEL